ncbi:hypothetical protein H6F98_10180 [Microcoleus sp. FACHB-SPT15]|nr:hypothetical protein [Microcoleus sp. FACHB-SPT15]
MKGFPKEYIPKLRRAGFLITRPLYLQKCDRKVEEFIVTNLAKSFPDDDFLAEERGGVASSKLWVIDPIDGTANFVRSIPFFGISIAYLIEGEVEIGVIYDPIADELFAARRGFGATCNGKAIRVSDCQDIAKAIVGCDLGYGTSKII